MLDILFLVLGAYNYTNVSITGKMTGKSYGPTEMIIRGLDPRVACLVCLRVKASAAAGFDIGPTPSGITDRLAS